MSVEHLDGCVGSRGGRSGSGSVADPVVDGSFGDDTESGGRDPFPECDVLMHQVRFDLLLEFNVEDL